MCPSYQTEPLGGNGSKTTGLLLRGAKSSFRIKVNLACSLEGCRIWTSEEFPQSVLIWCHLLACVLQNLSLAKSTKTATKCLLTVVLLIDLSASLPDLHTNHPSQRGLVQGEFWDIKLKNIDHLYCYQSNLGCNYLSWATGCLPSCGFCSGAVI